MIYMLSYTCSAQSRPAIFIPTESNIASSRFASLEGSTETFIEEQENQNTVRKTKQDVAFWQSSFKQKDKHEVKQLKFLSPSWMYFWVNLF